MYKCIILVTFVLTALLAVCWMSSADSVDMNGDEAIYEIPQTIIPPRIDGILNDVIWKVAPSVTIGILDTGGVIDEEYFSTVWVAYDSEKIYVAYKNFDPDPGAITCLNEGRDSAIWNDDECELFLEPANVGAEPYFQLCINAEAEIFDQESGGEGLPWDAESLQCATEIYNDHWVLEASFAFEDLDLNEAPVGETWGCNFNRHIVSGVDLWTGWSETGLSFHTPDKFGDIVFTQEKLAVSAIEGISTTWGRIKRDF